MTDSQRLDAMRKLDTLARLQNVPFSPLARSP